MTAVLHHPSAPAALQTATGGLFGLLARHGRALLGLGLISAMLNLLALTGSLFMMQVYDRVIPGHSVPTLVGLAAIVAALYAFQAAFDIVRSRTLSHLGAMLDATLSGRVFGILVSQPLSQGDDAKGLQPLRDLDQVRGFLSGPGPSALFDLPWLPFYVGLCFIFHPLIGIAALAGVLVLVVITALTEILTGRSVGEATRRGARRLASAEAARRNAEVVQALGMGDRLAAQWSVDNAASRRANQRTSHVVAALGSLSRVFRMALQSGVLALGAYLVINHEATGGIMLASSILSARALAPAEMAIAHWKGFVGARQSWRRLSALLAAYPAANGPLPLPFPVALLEVEGVSAFPPGGRRATVADVSFRLEAGQALGVIGASASGKSSLARLLVGAWTPARGKIRLDGAALDQWRPQELGRHLGYLPQDVELFGGTIAQNICRFETNADPEAIVAAARAAGVHDLVLHLPDGYETQIGANGSMLSAGQRQRIGLARALYGNPFLVVLDEPNSNLDAEGERALTRAIAGVRHRGGIAVVIAHRPSALMAVDRVLVMADGRMQVIGPKDEVLAHVLNPAGADTPAPLVVVSNSGQGAS